VARGDVTLGLSSPAFARMIQDAPALASRALEMLNQREQALGGAIATETGTDSPQQRVVAALLEIPAALAAAATTAFDLLEPSLGGYLVRAG
jgi:CRP-like cAMP-binding protein